MAPADCHPSHWLLLLLGPPHEQRPPGLGRGPGPGGCGPLAWQAQGGGQLQGRHECCWRQGAKGRAKGCEGSFAWPAQFPPLDSLPPTPQPSRLWPYISKASAFKKEHIAKRSIFSKPLACLLCVYIREKRRGALGCRVHRVGGAPNSGSRWERRAALGLPLQSSAVHCPPLPPSIAATALL